MAIDLRSFSIDQGICYFGHGLDTPTFTSLEVYIIFLRPMWQTYSLVKSGRITDWGFHPTCQGTLTDKDICVLSLSLSVVSGVRIDGAKEVFYTEKHFTIHSKNVNFENNFPFTGSNLLIHLFSVLHNIYISTPLFALHPFKVQYFISNTDFVQL